MKKSKSGMGVSPTRNHTYLYLTDTRSSQQNEFVIQAIKRTKYELMGKQFKVRPEAPKYCRKRPIAIIEYNEQGNIVKITLSRINCNSWTCPRCNMLKALKVKYLIKETAILNKLSYFLTLTLDPKKIPPLYFQNSRNNTHQFITKLYNTFITDLKRKNKTTEKLKYIWVMEFQKNGNAHLHILLNQFVDINLIRKIWVRVGGGHIMNIQPIKTLEGISSYVSDYIVKGLKHDISEQSYFKYFEKRYSISQSCVRPPKNSFSLFNGQTLEEKLSIIEDLDLQPVYNALIKDEFGEQLILFDKEGKKS